MGVRNQSQVTVDILGREVRVPSSGVRVYRLRQVQVIGAVSHTVSVSAVLGFFRILSRCTGWLLIVASDDPYETRSMHDKSCCCQHCSEVRIPTSIPMDWVSAPGGVIV